MFCGLHGPSRNSVLMYKTGCIEAFQASSSSTDDNDDDDEVQFSGASQCGQLSFLGSKFAEKYFFQC